MKPNIKQEDTDKIGKWVAEFAAIAPVDISDMDFINVARIAVDFGISPRRVLDKIRSMTRDEIAAFAEGNEQR